MFSKIMVPVDLAHEDKLTRALTCARDLAKLYGASVTYVGVTGSAPSALGHSPEEFTSRLEAFASDRAAEDGIETRAHAITSHDPAAEMNRALSRAVTDTGADLVVVASHVPGLAEHLRESHGGSLAEHSACSVMVVRG